MSISALSGLSTFSGGDRNAFKQAISSPVRRPRPLRFCPMMKNINEGKVFFDPIVVLGRNVIGNKRFGL
ncbi:Protein PROTON GRADIENT REGULATION 5, chloroplastic [Dendrobium catenatum]|uniref:Protein PROTON GRADIENT REGULATION 5, chloroplastic n=1 Tax=Dendrobium catenatum TaxID=906689 RepID=A0A2I0X650_9ASPA|nr:Protein PROTON GRADIENT REGULATION 5, chloroplastic [Dendrobium catenatum]